MTRPNCTCGGRPCRPCALIAGRDDYARLWDVSDADRAAVRERVDRLGGWVVPAAPPPGVGPGTELKKLLAAVGINAGDCSCEGRAAEMDRMGVAWCREHRAELVEHLKGQAEQRSWWEKVKAAALAVASGLAFKLDPFDPFGSLLGEAIQRAEKNADHSGGNLSQE